MSRFFHSGYSSDSSESSQDEESFYSSSSEEEILDNEQQQQQEQQSKFSRFQKSADYDDSDDESGDGKRVVKSGREKLVDEVVGLIEEIEDGLDASEFINAQTEYDKLIKVVNKSQNMIRNQGYPKRFLKFLVEVEEKLKAVNQKTLNKLEAKAMTAMKQKIRKFNQSIESELEEWKKNPVSDDEEEGLDDHLSESSEEEEVTGRNKWKKVDEDDKKEIKKEKKQKSAPIESTEIVEEVLSGKVIDVTKDNFYQRFRQVLDARGKKATDKNEQILILEKLVALSSTPPQKLKTLLCLISYRFDLNIGQTSYQSLDLWKKTEQEINQVLTLLEQNSELKLTDAGDEFDEELTGQMDNLPGEKRFRGSLVSLINRFDEEFQKSLLNTDIHTMEYVDRLKDDVILYQLIVRCESYYQKLNDVPNLCLIRMMRLEHVYYKYNHLILMVEEKIHSPVKDADQLVHQLCIFLYQNAADRLKTRAVLCHVFHHALHKRLEEARDLLLMSHLQETIQHADIPTQILYNRALVQIGICAFQLGQIKESHHCLHDVMASLKTKDILAQGTQLLKYTTAESERKDKQRLLPFHMHLNLELLEAIQLTVSMLLECPNMSQFPHDHKRRVLSKHFRRLFDQSQHQLFTGPPESFKDAIMQASHCLLEGNWKQCLKWILEIKAWDLLPESDKVKEMLKQRIQQEALRTFLFQFSHQYRSLSLLNLSKQFEISKDQCLSIIAKMILHDHFAGYLEGDLLFILPKLDALGYLMTQYEDKLQHLLDGSHDHHKQKSTVTNKQQQQQQPLNKRN